jgi:hypothetical protein
MTRYMNAAGVSAQSDVFGESSNPPANEIACDGAREHDPLAAALPPRGPAAVPADSQRPRQSNRPKFSFRGTALSFEAPFKLFGWQRPRPTLPDIRGEAHRVLQQLPSSGGAGHAATTDAQRRMDTRIEAALDQAVQVQLGFPANPANEQVGAASAQRPDGTASSDIDLDRIFEAGSPDAIGQFASELQRRTEDARDPASAGVDKRLIADIIASVTTDPGRALEILQAMCGDNHPIELFSAGEQSCDLARTLHAVATNESAFDALWRIKQRHEHARTGPAHRASYRTLLEAGAMLTARALVPPADTRDKAAWYASQVKDCRHLGTAEGPHALATCAFVGALSQYDGRNVGARDRAALMAWKQGFRTSGLDPDTGQPSDFNVAINAMHEFVEGIGKSVEKPKGFAGFFKKGAPLDAAKIGYIGCEAWIDGVPNTLENATKRYQAGLCDAVKPVIGKLLEHACAVGTPRRDAAKALIRAASLAVWQAREDGWRKNIPFRKLEGQSVIECAEALADRLGLNAIQPADFQALASKVPARVNISLVRSLGEKWITDKQVRATFDANCLKAERAAKGKSEKLDPRAGADALKDFLKKGAKDTIGTSFGVQWSLGVDASLGFSIPTPLGSLSLGAGPVVKASRASGQSVVIGNSSAGRALLLNSKDSRSQWQVGANVRASAAVVQGSATPYAKGGETASATGVALRIPKGSPNLAEQMDETLDFLFDAHAQRTKARDDQRRAPTRAGEGAPPAGDAQAAELWERFSARFLNSSVSVASVSTDGSLAKVRHGASGWAGLKFGGWGLGASGTIARETITNSSGFTERSGAHRGVARANGKKQSLNVSGGLSLHTPAIAELPDFDGLEIHLSGAELGSIGADFVLNGEEAQVRLMTLDGKVSAAHSVAYQRFRDPGDYLQLLQDKQERAAWVDAAAEKIHPGSNAAAADDVQANKAREIAARCYDEYLQQVANLPEGRRPGNRFFLRRLRLTKDAANAINPLLDHRKATSDAARVADIERQVRLVLKDSGSWEPDRLGPYEKDSAFRDRGLGAIGQFKHRKHVRSTLKYLAEFVPDNFRPKHLKEEPNKNFGKDAVEFALNQWSLRLPEMTFT